MTNKLLLCAVCLLTAIFAHAQALSISYKRLLPASLPNASAGYVADNGATLPQYASVREAGVYVVSQDTTYFTWEAWDTDHREAQVSSYDHTAGTFSAITDSGITALVDDDHGVPAIVRDHQGYIHLFGGAHHAADSNGGDIQYAVTDAANDVTAWTVQTEIAGDYGYVKPILYNGAIYLFAREGSAAGFDLVLYTTTALNNGAATWGSETQLVDFGTGRVYAGNFAVVGSEIWFVTTRSPSPYTTRADIFFFKYETTTGDVKNYAGTTTIDSLELPVDNTEADADFKLVDQSGEGTDIPVWFLDGSNRAHIFYGDGPVGGSFAIKYVYDTGSGWSDVETLAYTQNLHDTFAPVLLPNGDIQLYFAYEHSSNFDPTGVPVDGGPMLVTRYADGTLSRIHRLVDAGASSMGRFLPIKDGHADARVMFSELGDCREDVCAGSKKLFIYGDSGFLSR